MIVSSWLDVREIMFKYEHLLELCKKEPHVSIETCMWAVEKLWKKEIKNEKELVN